MKIIFAAIACLLTGGCLEPSYAKEYPPTVNAGLVCTDLSGAVKALQKDADALTEWVGKVAPGLCVNLYGMDGNMLPILGQEGPYIDYNGYRFFVVKVSDGLFTLAWPGQNTDMESSI